VPPRSAAARPRQPAPGRGLLLAFKFPSRLREGPTVPGCPSPADFPSALAEGCIPTVPGSPSAFAAGFPSPLNSPRACARATAAAPAAATGSSRGPNCVARAFSCGFPSVPPPGFPPPLGGGCIPTVWPGPRKQAAPSLSGCSGQRAEASSRCRRSASPCRRAQPAGYSSGGGSPRSSARFSNFVYL